MTVRATSAASTSAAAASDVSRSAFVRLVSVPRVIHVSSLHRVDLDQRRACRVTVVDARAAAGRGPGRGVGEIDRGRRSRGVHTLLGAHTRCEVLFHLHLGLVVLLAVARVQIRPRRVVSSSKTGVARVVGPAAAGGAAAEPSGGSPEASLSFSGPTGSLLISPVSPSASTRDSLDATRARNADARDLRPSRSRRSCSRDPTRAPIRTAVSSVVVVVAGSFQAERSSPPPELLPLRQR